MHHTKKTFALISLASLLACRPIERTGNYLSSSPEMMTVPSRAGGMPNLSVDGSGTVLLSWIEYLNDTTDALFFSQFEGAQWSAPREVARGSNWFVNWADFPSITAYRDRPDYLAAHWLQKSAGGVYDYDVRIAQSRDGGQTWSPSFVPHTDSVPAEHGFVSLLPLDNGRTFAVWLDGRNTKGTGHASGGHDHGHAGAMTLRCAEFDIEGGLHEEAELDSRICDCCQTDAILTDTGPVVVYRDRSEDEIRDISIVRKVDGQWTTPRRVFEDNWEIAGCPVNGPAIAALGNTVAIAWFTGAGGENQVKLAFSEDAGDTFSLPVRVDSGKPLGRVDVVLLNAGAALVSWLENTGETGEVRLAIVRADGTLTETLTAVQTGTSRQSGFPILEKDQHDIWLAWTHVDSITTVRTAKFSLPD